ENPRSHALLEIFGALSVRLELPVESARARIVRREQRGAPGVVANAEDLVEDALLELAVLAALADLVDGQYVHVTQRLEPLARGDASFRFLEARRKGARVGPRPPGRISPRNDVHERARSSDPG